MADKTEKRINQNRVGFFGVCFFILSRILLWTMLGLLLAIIISSLFYIFIGNQKANIYLTHLLQGQLRYLGVYANCSFLVSDPLNFAVGFAQWLYKWMFVKTHFISFLAHQKINLTHSQNVNQLVEVIVSVLSSYMKLFITTVELMSVKFAISILTIPCFILFGIIGLVDGMVQRDLRKFGGGRESALIYHEAKSKTYITLLMGFLLYLIMPFDIAPEFIFLPFAILFGYIIAMMTSKFKKYV